MHRTRTSAALYLILLRCNAGALAVEFVSSVAHFSSSPVEATGRQGRRPLQVYHNAPGDAEPQVRKRLLGEKPLSRGRQLAARLPPSTYMVWPVMYDEASEHKNRTAPTTSSGSPSLDSGMRAVS